MVIAEAFNDLFEILNCLAATLDEMAELHAGVGMEMITRH
jgi:hypothetical protein